ncbi:MAG: carbamoyl-phosphate synthase large subunit [Myxococcales bacterium]|nr:carbamoyl-phosphate synthase large subunit [Myxococcales bacterium]
MPRRDDIKRVLLIGSGPIVIGQACEFDYSGTQGAKALRQEGYEVVLVNSNPATVMTDPEFAQRTYVEPLDVEVLRSIIARERPDALLPTLGGQTALNLAMTLDDEGVLAEYGVELIGASVQAIRKAEDRELFNQAMERCGLSVARSYLARTDEQAWEAVRQLGYPLILRPSFTLGGSGGGVAHDDASFAAAIQWAFSQSPTHECLIEESLIGWKEYELEVIRDRADNFSVICTIENLDPMGVHTGDSITIAPAMTLTDKEYQQLRDAARAVITEIGVDTGGSNIQFSVNPRDGRIIVIEMNPRVSRSSALASKATGYPIAKIAAKLAVGYRLDELRNDVTGTSAAFEPSIDYVVTKIPRFAFEKFQGADQRLTTQMKSVGEVMAIGRTFKQSLLKATRSLEIGRDGLPSLLDRVDYRAYAKQLKQRAHDGAVLGSAPRFEGERQQDLPGLKEALLSVIETPLGDRLWYAVDALRVGCTAEEVCEHTAIDPWFVQQLCEIVAAEQQLKQLGEGGGEISDQALRDAKVLGLSDGAIGTALGREASEVRAMRLERGLRPIYARVDSCAAEFPALTPYLYSTWGEHSESEPSTRKKVMILGGGPNRIGQGIEFDYCCVHASFALRQLGIESVMVNCNPETVSTDYDTSDRLYFEPLTFEDVMGIVEEEKPDAVIVQFGGQTPLKLAVPLSRSGVEILGTPASAIDRAEDRDKFDQLLDLLGLKRPAGVIVRGADEAMAAAEQLGFPVVVRPSYVLGGRAMEIVHSPEGLERYMAAAFEAIEDTEAPTILVDEFLQDAIEVDVDCLADGERAVIGGILQHVEEAGVHSGDSTMVLPPHTLPEKVLAEIREASHALALELGVRGLMNVQFAVRGDQVYVIEVNPRASRTVPFVSKSIGRPLAQIATQVMAGKTLQELGFTEEVVPRHVAVKESVFPFAKLPGVDTILGPEMRSTGEVMGVGSNFPEAFDKAMLASGMRLPSHGKVFISVRDEDKAGACDVGRRLRALGFELVATSGTARALAEAGVDCSRINKVVEGSPHCVDMIKAGEIDAVMNTTSDVQAITDSFSIRRQALVSGVAYFTTMAASSAVVGAIEASRARGGGYEVRSLQEYHQDLASSLDSGA